MYAVKRSFHGRRRFGSVFPLHSCSGLRQVEYVDDVRPWGLELSPDGRKLYVANGLSNDVSVIDVAAQKVIATVTVGNGPWTIAMKPGLNK